MVDPDEGELEIEEEESQLYFEEELEYDSVGELREERMEDACD